MRIGVNCLQIDPSYVGGVNTYTLGLLNGFAAEVKECSFRLYVTSKNQHLFDSFRSKNGFDVNVAKDSFLSEKKTLCRGVLLAANRGLYKRFANLAFETVWRTMEAESDIIYTPTVVLQYFNSSKPTVLSMHDIQHLHYPEFFRWTQRLNRSVTYSLSAEHANYFQASSQFIKDDLLEHFPAIDSSQIRVIPEGVNVAEFSSDAKNGAVQLDRYHLPKRFLFCPAQLWPHKNHLTVLRALKQIEFNRKQKIPLVLTGAKYSGASEIFRYIAQESMDYVSYLGKVPFPDLVAIYRRAAFLVSAGLYESNCLPILEAAAAGVPVIASDIPPNRELAEVLKLNLFSPLDVDDVAQLIYRLWNHAANISADIQHNREHISQYSWRNAANKYIRFFLEIGNS